MSMQLQLKGTYGSRYLSDSRLNRIKNAKTPKDATQMGILDRIIDRLNGGKKRRACELLWNMINYKNQSEMENPARYTESQQSAFSATPKNIKEVISNWFELKQLLSVDSRNKLHFDISPVPSDESCSSEESESTPNSEPIKANPLKLRFQFNIALEAEGDTNSDQVKESSLSLHCFDAQLDAVGDIQQIEAENDELLDRITEIRNRLSIARTWISEVPEPKDENADALSQTTESEPINDEDEKIAFKYFIHLNKEEFRDCMNKYPEFRRNPLHYISMKREEIATLFERRKASEMQLLADTRPTSSSDEQRKNEVKLEQYSDSQLQKEVAALKTLWNTSVDEYICQLEQAKVELENRLQEVAGNTYAVLGMHHKDFLLDAETTEQHFSDNRAKSDQSPKVRIRLDTDPATAQAKLIMNQVDKSYSSTVVDSSQYSNIQDAENIEEEGIEDTADTKSVSSLIDALSASQRFWIHP